MNAPNPETLRKVSAYVKEHGVQSIVEHIARDGVVVWNFLGDDCMWQVASELASILGRNITWNHLPNARLYLEEK